MASKYERLRMEAHRLLDELIAGRLVNTIYFPGSKREMINLGPLKRAIEDAYNARPHEAVPSTVLVQGKRYRLADIETLPEVRD